MSGKLYVVSVPIGDPDDLSPRARRVLREVSVIAAEDTQTTQRLLRRHHIHTALTSYNWVVLREKTPVLLRRLQDGQSVALVCDAGTPTVADPGTSLVRAALESGIRVSPVPGPSAMLAALMASGCSGDAIVFQGMLPAQRHHRRALIRALAGERRTIILFERPERLVETLELVRHLWGNRRVSAAFDLTGPEERVEHTTVAALLRNLRKTPVTEEVTLVFAGRKPSRRRLTSRSRTCG